MSMQAIAGSVSPEDIQKLLKKGRTRGDYESVIRSFLSSGEAGVGKDPKEGEEAEEQHVYIIDTSKVQASDEGSEEAA